MGGSTAGNPLLLPSTNVSDADDVTIVRNHLGLPMAIPVLEEGIYMIDFDVPKYLPELQADLTRHLKLDLLPRGERCMLRHLPLNGHPFMGPNLYITPPGTFTHFHQDGHGTVDSGHLCLRGRNEVVMLRRLDEPNKLRALRILNGSCLNYDALYGMPHNDGQKPSWPTPSQIESLRDLNYCPSVFTLEPGEFVHINKGRLHAFRKKIPASVQEPEQFCVSVAWDWIYQGSSPRALKEEMDQSLECVALNRKQRVASLGHVENSILQAMLSSTSQLKALEASMKYDDDDDDDGGGGLG
eukprot:CAMPEP_0185751146 /NCGR_PEP_ID=MMETSP1174-20130828/9899_1 /TAXON_ID=35687 /ORGANISM="Dictyocha speculum, Strain CCMP1381" /LENGTH=297 /DNA_ID=CAMNT_0028427991 /DNA_START=9 /DNA_END=899 /DNA_ORIENTATION=-